jgi:hypothetical protein
MADTTGAFLLRAGSSLFRVTLPLAGPSAQAGKKTGLPFRHEFPIADNWSIGGLFGEADAHSILRFK